MRSNPRQQSKKESKNVQQPSPPPPPPQKPVQEDKQFNPDLYVRQNLSRDEVIELKKAFDLFDDDGSGTIDPAELKGAFEELGLRAQNKMIYQVLGEIDQDNQGGFSFDNFIKLATAKQNLKETRGSLMRTFNLFDLNREGRITWDELKRVSVDLGDDLNDEEIKKIFRKADLNDDGFVTFEDFYNMMTGRVYYD
ncbi:unnamed protein product [Paramecium primaurelia]|uniref:Calmodulin n=2 Tax=Paramecium TaxID=5884 RepID=A0A8S1TGM9_9CILI|nr:unnamed protein product [Paramecium primaurelia]CAD8150957.1 unnamed protein product [Paramecium pentaurelia]